MTLTPEQLAKRGDRVTASFAPYLIAGREDRIRSEWCKLVGHPAYEEPNWDERFDTEWDWYQRKTQQQLIRRGEVVVHPTRNYVCCTLDAYRAEDDCVVDCKAWKSYQKVDYICSFLAPQMIVQKACVRASAASILLVHGGARPVEYPLSWEPEYEAQVWGRIDEFWQCVQSLTPPVALPTIEPPVVAVREMDMSSSNAWCSWAMEWLVTRADARQFEIATKELKELVPRDVKRAFGQGVEVTRAKNGAATIREEKSHD
jgi:hypothetical protein